MQVDVHLDESLLQKVVHIVRTARALDEEPVYGVAVAVEEVFESVVVAFEHAADQLPVVGYDVFGYLHTRSSRRSSESRSTAMPSGSSRS